MIQHVVEVGTQDVSVELVILNATTGVGIDSIEHDTAGLSIYYRRNGAADQAITLAALTALTDAHADGGIENIGGGVYRLDLPDAACAAGASSCVVGGTGTGIIIIATHISLVAYNPQDAVRLGLSSLPNAAADAAGGLPISDAGGLDLDNLSVVDTNVTTLINRLTALRAGYLDKLNIAGNVASQASVDAIQNTTRVRVNVPEVIERPDSGSTDYVLDLYLYDTEGNMEAPDSLPTVSAENQAGADRSANLGTVTLVSTGHYEVAYTVANTHAIEQVKVEWSVVEGGVTTVHGRTAQIVDTTAVDFTAADRAKLDELHDNRLTSARATNLDNLDAAITTRSSHDAAAVRSEVDANSTRLAAIEADTNEAQGKLPSGTIASSAEVTAIHNTTRVRVVLPTVLERPDSGSVGYQLDLYLYDTEGSMEAPDSLPTITAKNQEGTDRSGNLGTVTLVSTGVYHVTYTVASAHAIEQIRLEWSVVEGGVTTVHGRSVQVVDTTAVDFTAADRTKLDTLHDTRLTAARATNLDNLDAAVTTRSSHSAGGVRTEMDANSTRLAAIEADTNEVQSRLNEMTEDDGGVRRFTANALEEGPTGSAGVGDGAYTVVVTVTASGTPIGAARVRLVAGANSYATATDSSGEATFNLDAGTYTVSATRGGYSYTGSTHEVTSSSATHALTVAMTATATTPPSGADKSTGTSVILDAENEPEEGVVCEVEMTVAGTASAVYDGALFELTSDQDGVIEYTSFARGATYRIRRDSGRWVTFEVPDADTFTLPKLIGGKG